MRAWSDNTRKHKAKHAFAQTVRETRRKEEKRPAGMRRNEDTNRRWIQGYTKGYASAQDGVERTENVSDRRCEYVATRVKKNTTAPTCNRLS